MSARLARNTIHAATRRVATNARMTPRIAKRNMSAVGDAAHAAKSSTDRLWILGSAVIFGPAFLYLVSPSARKNRHDFHDDKHDFPGFVPKEAAPTPEASTPVIMKDSEGESADVSQSVKIAEQDDAPKQAPTPESQPTSAAAESHDATQKSAGSTDKYFSGEQQQTHEVKSDVQLEGAGKKAGTFSNDEPGPSDQGAPRVAGQKGITPKEKAEGADESK
ncbi:hypothetical protein BDQ17DRAFT_583692 [Cyathus striatus]|nr:hypothetical protein BDQ17DRAFT_583692 [Cyathus striatus]